MEEQELVWLVVVINLYDYPLCVHSCLSHGHDILKD